jgi:hypothetical protein
VPRNRDGTFCRNNARGLLGSCQIVQHSWQNVKLLIHRSSWDRFFRGVFLRVGARHGSALGTLASAFIAAGGRSTVGSV